MDSREAIVSAVETVGELLVVESKEMESGGIQIMNVNRIADNVVGEIIGFAVGESAANTCPRHPDRIAAGVVISSVVVVGQRALGIDGAPELSSPDNECFV